MLDGHHVRYPNGFPRLGMDIEAPRSARSLAISVGSLWAQRTSSAATVSPILGVASYVLDGRGNDATTATASSR